METCIYCGFEIIHSDRVRRHHRGGYIHATCYAERVATCRSQIANGDRLAKKTLENLSTFYSREEVF